MNRKSVSRNYDVDYWRCVLTLLTQEKTRRDLPLRRLRSSTY